MKLYDFSVHAKRRDANQSAERVCALRTKLNEPGAVIELKARVQCWLVLHEEILKMAS